MTLGFSNDFEKDLELILQQEVLLRITAAVADEFAVSWSGEQMQAGALDAVGERLLQRLDPKAAAKLVLGLVKHMHAKGHINYCHEDRCLWEGWAEFEVRFPEDMDNCG